MKQTNSSHKRVIYFSFGILEQGGGFETYLISTTRGLADRYKDLHISIVTMSPGIVEKLQYFLSIYLLKWQDPKGIYRESTVSIKQRLSGITYMQANSLRELANILNGYDVIYSKNEILELTVLKYLKRKIHKPIIVGIHTSIYYPIASSLSAKLHNLLYTGPLYKWLIRDMSSVEVNQSEDKFFLENRGLKTHNVNVIHHPIQVDQDRQVANQDSKLRVLFAGRFIEQKGIDVLTEIIQKLSDGSMLSDFEFKIAGSGEPSLTHKINEISDKFANVVYVGHIAHKDIIELYDWTDVTLIPSRCETLSLIAIETAVAAKVAIASDIPGPREVIENGKTGFLVEFNVPAFVEILHQLFTIKRTNYEKLRVIGKAAQKKVAKEYDPTTVFKQLYEQLQLTSLSLEPKGQSVQTFRESEQI